MASANGPWPPPSEFNRMLQNPRLAFKPTDLQNCTIDCDVHGQPTVRSGAFATVYKGTYPSGENVCLRVFTSKAEDRRERYAAISDYVRSQKLRFLVNFNYHEAALRHPSGKWFPLVTMEWVEGNVLFDWLREKCLRNDVPALHKAAEQWVDLVAELARARIAHGDLQHNNVMVTAAGEMKLVDYDGMCVPAIEGRVNLELGVEPYQHPERGPDTKLSPDLDNFSALFIFVALRALAAEPHLWSAHIEQPNGEIYDKLLFRKSDFDDPQNSALIRDLKRSSDAKVPKLVDELIRLRQIPIQNVPRLAQAINDFDAIRQLLQKRDWEGAAALLKNSPPHDVPANMSAAANDALARVKCRDELAAAVENGDEQTMHRLCKSALLKNFPAAQALVDVASRAGQVIPILNELEAARQAQDWRKLVATWNTHKTLLQSRLSSKEFRDDIELAHRRNQACDQVLSLLADPAVEGQRLQAAWQALRDLGGHPEADRCADDVTRSVGRKLAYDNFRKIPDALAETVDRKLVKSWNEVEFQGLEDVAAQRERYTQARARSKLVKALRESVEKAAGTPTQAGEREIREAARRLPAGYAVEGDLPARVNLADRRVKACHACQKLLAAENPTEDSLAAAWKALLAANGESLADAAQRSRFELAQQRGPLLLKLADIRLSKKPDAMLDQQLLKVWSPALLQDCHEAAPWKAAHAAAVQRKTRLAELRKLIEADEDFAIAACVDDPCFEGYEFSGDIKERLIKTRQSVQGVKGLIDTLHAGQKTRFVELFDQDVVRKFAGRFAPYQARLSEWVKTEILPRQTLGLKEPHIERSITASPGRLGRWQFRWTWPPRRFSSQCLLAFCRAMPSGMGGPEQIAGHRIHIERRQWESAGAYYDIKPDPAWGVYVAVWAEVDLGFERLLSEPLVLGRLGA